LSFPAQLDQPTKDEFMGGMQALSGLATAKDMAPWTEPLLPLLSP